MLSRNVVHPSASAGLLLTQNHAVVHIAREFFFIGDKGNEKSCRAFAAGAPHGDGILAAGVI
ncbi:MAG: hypothetical protein ILP18_10095 [Treponema sp.]|nr:hypothetical protein [Treponema sp.]